MTQEFYTNAWEGAGKSESRDGISYVRGKKVNYGPWHIRNYLQLGPKSTETQDYQWRMDNDLRLEEVLRDIGNPGAQWKVDSKGQPTMLKRWDLLPIAKAWLDFIQHNILPTSNLSDVNIARAVLVHCIMEGRVVKVENLIANQIFTTAQNLELRGKLGYPCLIKRLCKEVGLTIQGDVPLGIGRPITMSVITRPKRKPTGQGAEATEEAAAMQTEAVPAPEPTNPPEATPPPASPVATDSMDAPVTRREFQLLREELLNTTSLDAPVTRREFQLLKEELLEAIRSANTAPPREPVNMRDLDASITRREFNMFRNEINHKLDYHTLCFNCAFRNQIPKFRQIGWTPLRFDGTVDEDDERYKYESPPRQQEDPAGEHTEGSQEQPRRVNRPRLQKWQALQIVRDEEQRLRDQEWLNMQKQKQPQQSQQQQTPQPPNPPSQPPQPQHQTPNQEKQPPPSPPQRPPPQHQMPIWQQLQQKLRQQAQLRPMPPPQQQPKEQATEPPPRKRDRPEEQQAAAIYSRKKGKETDGEGASKP